MPGEIGGNSQFMVMKCGLGWGKGGNGFKLKTHPPAPFSEGRGEIQRRGLGADAPKPRQGKVLHPGAGLGEECKG